MGRSKKEKSERKAEEAKKRQKAEKEAEERRNEEEKEKQEYGKKSERYRTASCKVPSSTNAANWEIPTTATTKVPRRTEKERRRE